MKYYTIDPDVPGELTAETHQGTPESADKIGYIFDCWPEADIIQADPYFAVSLDLKQAIENEGLSGVAFGQCDCLKGEQFSVASPEHKNDELPKYYWLKVNGDAEKDDFGISDDLMLVISENARGVLSRFDLTRADIEDI